MRGVDDQTSHLFNYLSPAQRVRPDNPLQAIRELTDEALDDLSPPLRRDVRLGGPPVDPAGSSCCGPWSSRRCVRCAASGC